MSKFKVGDRVRITGEGGASLYHYIPIGTIATVYGVNNKDRTIYVHFEEGARWVHYSDAELFTIPNTLTPGQTYTSANGTKWECLFVKGDTAWMAGEGYDCLGTAYRFKLNGTNIDQGGGLWDIVFEPSRKEVKYGLNYDPDNETQHFFGSHDTDGENLSITFDLIDGKPDWSTVKVTPAE